MVKVNCQNDHCRFLKDGQCTAEEILLDLDGMCEAFEGVWEEEKVEEQGVVSAMHLC